MTADDTGGRRPRWRPPALTSVTAVLAFWCTGAGWIGRHRLVTGNDPAGNGMATALVQGFAQAGIELTALLIGLYLLCRWRPVRYACVTLLALLSVAMAILVR